MLRPSTVHANAARAPVGGARSPVQEGSAKESEGLSLVRDSGSGGSGEFVGELCILSIVA